MFLTSAKTIKKGKRVKRGGDLLPPPENGSKRSAEIFSLGMSVIWIALVGEQRISSRIPHLDCSTFRYSYFAVLFAVIVIATQAFEQWKEWEYMYFCVWCAAPYFLIPLMRTAEADMGTPISQRYIIKFNLWIAIFSFIGNYW
eukprot:261892-Prorocentrum_minimum.AAC.2